MEDSFRKLAGDTFLDDFIFDMTGARHNGTHDTLMAMHFISSVCLFFFDYEDSSRGLQRLSCDITPSQ